MKKRPYIISDRSGFTTLELVVIIGILTVLAFIAIPGYTSWMPSYHLKEAARDIYSNLQLARLDAIKRNNTSTVTINTGANTYIIDSPDRTVSLGDYGGTVSFTNTDDMDATITFDARGMATFAPDPDGDNIGEVFITNRKNSATYRIGVSLVGTITLINQ